MKTSKLFLAAVCAMAVVSCNQKHVLFEGGVSDYAIVVSPDAGESEQYAAEELRDWISEVGGVTLPIVGPDQGVAGKRLVVGSNSVLKSVVRGAEEFLPSNDAFNYLNKGGDVFFWGGSTRGTLYSVYSFLENELDIRWYTSKVTVAPKRDAYAFTKLHNHEEPGIRMRDNHYYDLLVNPVFSARMRNNDIALPSRTPGKAIPLSGESYWESHTFQRLVPPRVYFETHPEYFSLLNGKRTATQSQLCLSNPEVLQLCIEGIKKVMRENPNYLIYSVAQNDNLNPCQCEECQKLAEQYGGESGVMIWFCNQVAEAVKEEFPDKFIGTFAYQYTRKPPKNIKPVDNLVVRLCSIECCLLHDYDDCDLNTDFLEDMKAWAEIAPHLYIWDYVTPFTQYCIPLPNFRTLQSHIQDFRKYNAIGMMEEGDYQAYGSEFEELRAYLLSKLMWNPDADVDAIIKDFTDGYYGPAGAIVREYLDYEHDTLIRDGIHQDCFPMPYSEIYTDEFVEGGLAIMDRARKAVADQPEYLSRVELAEFPLFFMQYERTPEKAIEQGNDVMFKKVIDEHNITRLAEWGGYRFVEDFYNKSEAALRFFERWKHRN